MKSVIDWITSLFFPYNTMVISLEELAQTDIVDLAMMREASVEEANLSNE